MPSLKSACLFPNVTSPALNYWEYCLAHSSMCPSQSLRQSARQRQVQKRGAGGGPFLWRALVIFAAALSVRLAHLWSMRRSPFVQVLLGDAQAYDTWARQIASGDWVGHDVFYQAPLYAYFLAAIYAIHRSLLFVRVCHSGRE